MARRPVKLAYDLIVPKVDTKNHLSPLVFMHGLSFSKKHGWLDIPRVIANLTKRKVYNLDARNHGDSEWSDEFDFDLTTEDLLNFMDEKKIPKVGIIGHCMGGITGIKTALKAPERVEMLFVEDIFIDIPKETNEMIIFYFNAFKEVEKLIPKGIDKKEADKFITMYCLKKKDPRYELDKCHEILADLSYALKKDPSGRYLFKANLDVLSKKSEDLNALVGKLNGIYRGPTYFLFARKSLFLVYEDKPLILKYFPNAQFIPFEIGNHFIHKECPERYVTEVVKYINLNEKI